MSHDLVDHLADILETCCLAHRKSDAEASFDSNEQVDMLERIPAVNISCGGGISYIDVLIVENILEYLVKLYENLVSCNLESPSVS